MRPCSDEERNNSHQLLSNQNRRSSGKVKQPSIDRIINKKGDYTMDLMTAKFQRLGIDNAPGQEDRQSIRNWSFGENRCRDLQ